MGGALGSIKSKFSVALIFIYFSFIQLHPFSNELAFIIYIY